MRIFYVMVWLSFVSLHSCFGPFDPYNPPPDQKDTTSITVSTKGLLAYWSCDDSAGSTGLKDSLGKNDGVLFGAISDSGVEGKGLRFNGTDSYAVVEIPKESAMDFGSGDFTVSLWVKPLIYKAVTDSTRFDIISSGIAKEHGFTISIYRKSFGMYVGQFKNNPSDTTYDATEKKWHHIVCVRRHSTVALYVNGSKIQSYANDNDLSGNGDVKIMVGDDASPRNDNAFPGIIDKIKIYTIAWDETNIRSEYNRFK